MPIHRRLQSENLAAIMPKLPVLPGRVRAQLHKRLHRCACHRMPASYHRPHVFLRRCYAFVARRRATLFFLFHCYFSIALPFKECRSVQRLLFATRVLHAVIRQFAEHSVSACSKNEQGLAGPCGNPQADQYTAMRSNPSACAFFVTHHSLI